MDAFADKLGAVGAWCGQNKYLNAVKNAFQNYMPATISGAVGVLWCNVLVNESTGLGVFFKPIMVLQPINTVFSALNTATIGCMAVGVTMLLAQEIADANGEQTGAYPAVLGFMMWMMVTPTSMAADALAVTGADGTDLGTVADLLAEGATVASNSGVPTSYMGATGLFTGLVLGILGTECYCKLRKVDALKIKMPDSVPPGVSRAFEILVPTCINLIIVGTAGWLCETFTGYDMNSLISAYVQQPLKQVIGANIVAVMFLYVIIMLFWVIGMHGNNMVSAVKESIFTPMLLENTELFNAGKDPVNKINITMMQMFAEWGGSGCTLGLIACILIFSKREDNRTIATISVVPGMFNINETMTFGIPLVLNPILDVPFILVPPICVLVGYILTMIGFAPVCVIQAPWTCPPLLFGFIATGGDIMGAVSQIVVFAIGTVIYFPFFMAYEANQNKESAEA